MGILNMDFRYPGIEIKVELIVLQAYLSQIENGVKSVCESYISAEMKKYSDSDFTSISMYIKLPKTKCQDLLGFHLL